MISYKLAKQLKDAGWDKETYWFYSTDETDGPILTTQNNTFDTCIIDKDCKKVVWAYAPTLSELIDACKSFRELHQYLTHDGKEERIWVATVHQNALEGVGKTKEIAVAKLYIKLNE